MTNPIDPFSMDIHSKVVHNNNNNNNKINSHKLYSPKVADTIEYAPILIKLTPEPYNKASTVSNKQHGRTLLNFEISMN